MSNSNHTPGREWRRAPARRRVWLLCFLATLAVSAAQAATRVEVRDASISLDDGVYELDARLNLSVPDGARRAIDAGLTLRLNYQVEIGRARRYLPDPEVAAIVQSFELSYHALSQRYLVRNLNTGEQFDHGSLDGALERVAEVRGSSEVEWPSIR